jgi:hypothetical protein
MIRATGSSGGSGGSGTTPAPPNRRLEPRVERVLRVETSPRTLALLAVCAARPLRALRVDGAALRPERVDREEVAPAVMPAPAPAPLTEAPSSLRPQLEQKSSSLDASPQEAQVTMVLMSAL